MNKTKRILMSWLALLMCCMGVWAIETDTDGYYLIGSVQDWKDFAELVRTSGNVELNARMTADIDLGEEQAMLGDCEHEDKPNFYYQGTFDGQGHTLTVHYTGTSQTAPFAMISKSTIKNLHVDGTIANSTGSQPSVIARIIYGTSTVENVWSSVVTTDTRTGWDEAAALVGCVDGYKSGSLVMHDCLFTGTLTSKGSYNGCFFGYMNSGGSVSVSNCLSLGTFNYTGGSYGFNNGTNSSALTNCFVKQWPTTIPANMQATDEKLASGEIAYKLQAMRGSMFWGQTIGEDPVPVLTNDESKRVYRTLDGFSNTPDEGELQHDTEGYYLLGSVDDWKRFAMMVDDGFGNINARMTADIDLGEDQTMVGDGYYNNANLRVPFRGIFDGQGHTLTVNYITDNVVKKYTDAGVAVPGYLGCAPFCYVWGGTIRNLHTAGTITATHEGVAGIVGWTNGSVLIENCHSSVDITYTNGSRGAAGIAYNDYNDSHVLTIRDCIYDGTLTAGTNKTGSAGMVIYRAYGTVNIYNSLVTATFANGMGASDCCTFVRNHNGTISNSFYQTALGTVQGLETTATELANGRTTFYLQADRTDLVWGQEIGVDPMPVLTSDESKRVYRSATGYTNDPAEAIADQALVPLTYTRDSEGNLTITGCDQGFTPPADYTLVIPDKIDDSPVVAIANSAFFQKSNFTSLYIGKNVKTIGNEAFRQAKGITSVTFADDCVVESFGNSAFRGCDELASFTMPNTVKTIGEMCFQADPKLASVTLSNQLTALAPNSFNGCTVLDGVTIPASVTNIGNNAFTGCTGLTSIAIPKTVTSMGTYVFSGCTALATASFADDTPLTAIPVGTFDGCSALSAFTIPATISTVGTFAFRNTTTLTAISFPATVKTLDQQAFYRSGLTSVTLPATITSMGSGVFQESKVETVTVNCATLGVQAFLNCTSLESLTLSNGVATIGAQAFQGCTKLPSVAIPASVTSMGNSSFNGCTLLETVTFANGINLATIPAACFYECRALESISIPASVTKIDNEAFRRCSAMTDVAFPEGTQLSTIGNDAFRGCSLLTVVHVPETVETIGERAFQACTELENVVLPSTLQVISASLFQESKMSDAFVLPSSVISIGNSAFQSTQALGTLTIPASVTTMGTNVFNNAKGLEEVVFEDGIALANIPTSTFQSSSIQRCAVPASVKSIDNNAFYQCTQLESVTMPQGLTSIGNSAFRYCEKLDNVTLPGTLNSILDWSFANCTAMENLTVEEGVSSINRDVFQFSGMKNVVLPSTLGSIGVNLFHGCPNLEVLDLSKCINVWELYNMTTVQRTGGSGQWNIFFGVPATTLVKMPPYAQVEAAENVEVDKESFDLTQDGEGYYLINDADDWDKFATYSRLHPTINARLTADISLDNGKGRLGIGNYDNTTQNLPYKGTFDGQRHTITVDFDFYDRAMCLFMWTQDATIHQLKVDGNIRSRAIHTGGFIRSALGTLTLEDCESAVTMIGTVTAATNLYLGGFLGHGHSAQVTMTDCLFSGQMLGGDNVRTCAGLMAWIESSGRATFNYSLNIGTFGVQANSCYSFYRSQSTGQVTLTACYSQSEGVTFGQGEVTPVSSKQLASGMVTYRLQGGREEQHWGQLIGTDPVPRLTDEEGTLVYHQPGLYSNTEGEGGLAIDEEGYYLIGTADDWKMLATVVEDGEYDAKARMTADINLGDDQTMIGSGTTDPDADGSANIKYQGTFDGQGHTLTIHYVATEHITAPFRFIQEATIQNLRIDGTIVTAYRNAGGIVGICFGQQKHSYITGCVSSVSISSSYVNIGDFYGGGWHGGIAARLHYYGQLHITDCVFNGSISGETQRVVWGGILGIPDGTVTITNCLQTGTFGCTGVISGSNGSGTFSTLFGNGYASRVNMSNCYYLNQLGNAQGTKKTEEQLADGSVTTLLQAAREETVWAQDAFTDGPMPALFANKLTYIVPASGIGTFSARTAVTIPEELKAHYGSKLVKTDDGLSLVMKPVEGDVPGSTGVLLVGEPGTSVVLTPSEQEPAAIADSALVAVVNPTHIEQIEGDYTNFMLKSGQFVKIAEASQYVLMPAHRAYLPLLTSELLTGNEARAITLWWGDEPTSINGIASDDIKDDAVYYTLDGRKLEGKPAQRGIYIVNGKKVMLK